MACGHCGTEFRISPSAQGRTRYCSLRCYVSTRETDIERRVREVLEERSIEFAAQVQIGPWVVDFLVEDLVIEADGTYWHSLGRDTDARKSADLESRGYAVWRVPGEQIKAAGFPAQLEARLHAEASDSA